jgi:integrase
VAGLRREIIERWYTERLGQVKASTGNKELGRLKHLLSRAVDWGYLRNSPATRVKKKPEPSGRIRYLTDDERQRLLDGGVTTVKASDGRSWAVTRTASPTLHAYIVAALQTGARRGELLGLQWRDVDLDRGTLTIYAGKSRGRARTMPITEPLDQLLRSLPRGLPLAPVLPRIAPLELTRDCPPSRGMPRD